MFEDAPQAQVLDRPVVDFGGLPTPPAEGNVLTVTRADIQDKFANGLLNVLGYVKFSLEIDYPESGEPKVDVPRWIARWGQVMKPDDTLKKVSGEDLQISLLKLQKKGLVEMEAPKSLQMSIF